MKNDTDEPKEYIERSVLFVVFLVTISISLDWLTVHFLINVNPWGMLVGIPGLVLTLQSLWFIVNPYAIVYNDRFEVKQSLFYNKQFYFLDAKDAHLNSNLKLVYNDDDLEKIPLFGIRGSQKNVFLQQIKKKIEISLQTRDF